MVDFAKKEKGEALRSDCSGHGAGTGPLISGGIF
jgi:hypothetical protein